MILIALTEAVGEVPEPTAKQSPQGAKIAVAQGTAVPCSIIQSKVWLETCCMSLLSNSKQWQEHVARAVLHGTPWSM